MRFVFSFGFFSQSVTLHAESIRTTPCGRIPSARNFCAMRQAFSTWTTNFFRSSASPMAEPPPVGGQTGATTEPMTNPLAQILSASFFKPFSSMSMLTWGSKRNRSTPSNLTPLTSALAVRSSMVSRSMQGSAPGLPLPTKPGHMALCNLGKLFAGSPGIIHQGANRRLFPRQVFCAVTLP